MRTIHLTILLVTLFLGLLLAVQFRIYQDIERTVPIQRVQKLTAEVRAARAERDRLQAQVNSLRAELDAATAQKELQPLKSKLRDYQLEAGMVAASGPGIEVVLNDSNTALQPGQNPNLYVLHDEDILRVLNELKAAGAEVLAINGERLLATSEVRCTGPTILVNKSKRLAAPFRITAIGDPDTMISALKMRGGVVDTLQELWGIQVSIRKLAEVSIPAYSGSQKFLYAHPYREER
ncbi:DUF881 domain-containing protein [Thermodesulfitimonas sp.]